ncbi:MAG: C4-type zinc ribbon domain-containing protein [Calditerrivibrio sp.]|nr:C4-type zinc ribbon domain-containing protein [Calditerrivibrio sp.]
MLEELEKLIELQRIDNRIFEINKILNTMPDYMVEIQDEYHAVRHRFEELKGQLEKSKKDSEIIKKEFENKKVSLDKSHKKLSTVKNTKEYEAVLKELDVLKKELYELELKSLEMTESVENLEKEFANIEEKRIILDKKYDEVSKRREKENALIIQELKELNTKRDELVSTVKKQYINKYETIRRARNNLAIVRVDNEICSGCYMKIPPQLFVEVKKNASIHQCPNCQRFLYYRDGE